MAPGPRRSRCVCPIHCSKAADSGNPLAAKRDRRDGRRRECRLAGWAVCGRRRRARAGGLHVAKPSRPIQTVMRSFFVSVVLVVSLVALATEALGGGHCGRCGSVAHATTPCGDTGCGPKVYGPFREPVGPCDPCDACVRWRGCNGAGGGQDMLVPWQMPPGRGFLPPSACGYASRDCDSCSGGCRRLIPALW